MADSFSIARARDQLTQLVHRAERGHVVELTRHGKPVAVLVSKAEYDRMTQGRMSFWTAYERFREEILNVDGSPGTDTFDQVRDRSPGRKVRL